MYSQNIYRFSPDFQLIGLYLILITVQFVILSIQNWYPRFFWGKKKFNYQITLGTEEEKKVISFQRKFFIFKLSQRRCVQFVWKI